MIDKWQRKIEYLRISITQKCDLNCIYCKPENEYPSRYVSLSVEDFRCIVKSMARLGIHKVRLTGGEPLLRKDLCEIVSAIASVEEIIDVSLTTNGIHLKELAEPLKKAGLGRINISLDSLQRQKFSYITGGGDLNDVLEGIDAALIAGLIPIKINVVLIKGVNDGEIDDFINLAKEKEVEVRFIELMPIGDFGEKNKDKVVLNSDIIQTHPMLVRLEEDSVGPATRYTINGYKGLIGFISPMSHRFCHLCNRIRLTCDGKLKPCLGENGEVDLLRILREQPEMLDQFIENTIFNKPKGHHFKEEFHSKRNMIDIGG